MKKKLLFLSLALMGGVSAAKAQTTLDDVDKYASRVIAANTSKDGTTEYDALEAEAVKDGRTIESLTTAINTLLATATNETPIYVRNDDYVCEKNSSTTIEEYIGWGWTFTLYSTTTNVSGNKWYNETNRSTNRGIAKWGTNAQNDAHFTSYSLPAGSYTLSMKIEASADVADIYYKIGDNEEVTSDIPTSASVKAINFSVSTPANVVIGVKDRVIGGWVAIYNTSLVYKGATVDPKDELRSAVSDAQAVLNAFTGKVGTTVFKYPQATYDELSSAISAANTLLEDEYNESTYSAAITNLSTKSSAMSSARWNEPDAGKLYTISYGSKYLNMSKGNGENVVFGIDNLQYSIQIVSCGNASYPDYYIIKDPSGTYSIDGDNDDYRRLVVGTANKWWKPTINSDGTVTWSDNNNYIVGWKSSDNTSIAVYPRTGTNNTTRNSTVAEAATTNASMFISSAAEWGTFVAPFAVDLTGGLAGVEAYTITTDGTTITKSEALSTIPANTPVLLHKAEGLSATPVSGYAQSYYTGLPESGNLVGFLAAGSVPASVEGGDTYYVLQKQDEVVGWYKVTDALTGTANRAYLKVPAAAGGEARQFMPLFGDSETTAIMSVNTEGIKTDGYYNLQGQRISNPKNGLYIVGGKKVVVK